MAVGEIHSLEMHTSHELLKASAFDSINHLVEREVTRKPAFEAQLR